MLDERYQQLTTFKEEKGHFSVCSNDPSYRTLDVWLKVQCHQYKEFLAGNKKEFTAERVEKLRALGLSLNEYPTKNIGRVEEKWNEMYQKLQSFKEEHGHCNVKQRDPNYPQLATWVMRQRAVYKKLKNGGRCNPRVHNQFEKLKALGFCFNRYGPDREEHGRSFNGQKLCVLKEKQWHTMYQKLQCYKEEHGHCNVNRSDPNYAQLAHWVKHQRIQYRKLKKEGHNDRMSQDRVEKLQALDFCFDRPEALWEEKLKELKEYQIKHGHCCVPLKYKANPRLGYWVRDIAHQYNLYKKGRHNKLSKEKIDSLERIDFHLRQDKKKRKQREEVEWDSDHTSPSNSHADGDDHDDEDGQECNFISVV